MYLLDTNVVSELRKPRPHGAVTSWVEGLDTRHLYLSAIVVGEVQAGVEVTRRQDVKKAAEIESWLFQIARTYRVLPLDTEVCREWARLMHGRSRALFEDAFIAATARVHGLVVATRNIDDFVTLGVEAFDPFGFRG